jgi:hypothetical protein
MEGSFRLLRANSAHIAGNPDNSLILGGAQSSGARRIPFATGIARDGAVLAHFNGVETPDASERGSDTAISISLQQV